MWGKVTINDIKLGPREHGTFDNENSNAYNKSFAFNDDEFDKEIEEENKLDDEHGIGDNKV